MTVKELITLLDKLPSNALVYVRGYEGGVNDVVRVAEVRVERDYHSREEWYYGQHEVVDNNPEFPIAYELEGGRT